jgi:murein DD-endopeptidase MepM/ murein hydrolase activator NlpD
MRKEKGFAWGIVLIAFGGIIFLAVAISFFAGSRDSSLVKGTGGAGGNGCILADQYFRDTTLSDNPEQVVAALVAKYSAAKDVTNNIKEILTEGKKRNINPVIPLAIWSGEQGFTHPEKAFGYGYKDSGTISGVTAWSAQLNGVYGAIDDAIQAKGNYIKKAPGADNAFTRLFFTYTTAMREAYLASGNTWDEEGVYQPDGSKPIKTRLAVIHLLTQNQLECSQNNTLLASTGANGCPVDQKIADATNGWGDVIKSHDYTTGTYPGHEGLDIMAPIGSNVYSVSAGTVVKADMLPEKENNYMTSRVWIEEKPGVFWYYTHLSRVTIQKGATVKAGDKLGESGTARVPHLHLGIANNPNGSTEPGYRWISNGGTWYYPYPFLKNIPCVKPPAASEVNYKG